MARLAIDHFTFQRTCNLILIFIFQIKIDRAVSTGAAIHVIESKSQKTTKKELDDKSKLADQKRLDSLKKMKSSYNEQKLAIKKALAGVVSSTVFQCS